MLLTERQQTRVIERAKEEVTNFLKQFNSPMDISKACLFWAYFTAKVIRQRHNLPAQLQAGSAYWPIIKEEEDDGVSPNRFGYEFSLDENCQRCLIQGILPEMHVWVGIAGDQPEIIDATAPFFKQRAIEAGFKATCEPPPFFWHSLKTPIPWEVSYTPVLVATKIAYGFINHAINKKPFVIELTKND